MSQKSSSKIAISSAPGVPRSGDVPKSGDPKSGEKRISEPKFDLIAELGRGGMATVYLARARNRPDRLVVLKQLRADLADNPDFLAMFLEEARLAGKLQHPNIVETYEVGQDGDHYYIAMEYLDGLSLQAVLTKLGWKGRFSFALQVFVLIEALRALETAYSQRDDDGSPLKIVHRDVSPPNIIIMFDGSVKLVDFGIAKAANSTIETRTGLIKGKLTYMAPEQAASGDVDSRTDIYSIGVMLWQAAAGKRRWKGVENTDVLKRLHAGKVSDSPDADANGLPEIVNDIVLKAIAAEPDDRYASAKEFRETLQKLLTDMHMKVGPAELGALLSEEFGPQRKRAAKVIRSRLKELDAAPVASTVDEKESITSIKSGVRTSVSMAAAKPIDDAKPAARDSRKAKATATERREKKQAPTLAKRNPTEDAHVSSKEKEAPDGSTTTQASPSPAARKSRAIYIGVAGVSIAAALAFFALRAHSHPSDSPAESPTTTVASTTIASASPVATDTPSAAPMVTADIAPTPPTGSTAPAVVANAPDPAPRGHGHHPHGGGSPAPSPVAVDPTAAKPPPMPAVATAATQTAPAATATSSAEALDKQDPWKQHAPTVDKVDPWGK